jgi:hypothetical protein
MSHKIYYLTFHRKVCWPLPGIPSPLPTGGYTLGPLTEGGYEKILGLGNLYSSHKTLYLRDYLSSTKSRDHKFVLKQCYQPLPPFLPSSVSHHPSLLRWGLTMLPRLPLDFWVQEILLPQPSITGPISVCPPLISFLFLQYWGLNTRPSPWVTPPALFCEGFFKIGSLKLFAQAGFEPQSSWSLPPE